MKKRKSKGLSLPIWVGRYGGWFGLALVLAACQSAVPTPIAPPVAAVTATATAIPSPTVTATATATATPSPTAEPSPTLTPSPTHTATPTPTPSPTPTPNPRVAVLGLSFERRALVAYQWGHGERHMVLVGGMHGGYEWNTVLLAYQMVDFWTANPHLLPPMWTLTIIPNANPDGMAWLLGREGRFTAAEIRASTAEAFPGRFNGRGVDLNRNWDCQWETTAVWQTTAVNPGTAPFSEPETAALRDFFLATQPELVLFWHSAAEGVFPAGCGRIDTASAEWAERYSRASGYPVYRGFSAYPLTGDASNWLTTQGVPSITIELATHTSPEWDVNLAGVLALLQDR